MAGKKAAIVGSGPAGLAAAGKLADAGFKVSVFEKLAVFGGIPAYAIPEFRMSMEGVKNRVNSLKEKGIEFIQKEVTSVKELLGSFDFVLIAIGAGECAVIGVKGEKINGVINALDFLYAQKVDGKARISKGENVAVIGGGNCAIDSARTVIMQGGRATIIYRRTVTELPAYKSEVEAAKKEGTAFEFLLTPIVFVGKNRLEKILFEKMQLSNPDETGRRRPIPAGEEIEKEFDKAIIAIGQNQNLLWLEKEGIAMEGGYKVKVDENYQTSIKRVYAAGDCITGAKTIADATSTGMGAAEAIMRIS